MKISKLERVVAGLKTEREFVAKHRDKLLAADMGDAADVIAARLAVIDEMITNLSEVDEDEAKPARVRKARKAGLPEVAKS